MKRAVIFGITGQDGSYLAEFLLGMGYQVHGVIRRSSSFNTSRINHLYQDPHDEERRLFLHYGDVTDPMRVGSIISEVQPDEVYNLAAQSHVRVSFDEPLYTSTVVALGTAAVLEALRVFAPAARFYQASSSEMFGASPPPQSEVTSFYPRSPYGVSKVYSYWLTRNYREAYDLYACNGILFNHESPRRGLTFVTRKITNAVAEIVEGKRSVLHLGNLDAIRDWGYAPEYVLGMWKMLQHEEPGDYVLATGTKMSVRDFVEAAFSSQNLDHKNHVEFDPVYIRPTEVDSLIGDSTKAKLLLNWESKISGSALVELMVEEDLKYVRSGGNHVDRPIFS